MAPFLIVAVRPRPSRVRRVAAVVFSWPDAFFRGKNAGRVRPTPVGMFLRTSKAAGAAPRLASWTGVFAWRARPPHPARKRRDAQVFHQEVSRRPPASQEGLASAHPPDLAFPGVTFPPRKKVFNFPIFAKSVTCRVLTRASSCRSRRAPECDRAARHRMSSL